MTTHKNTGVSTTHPNRRARSCRCIAGVALAAASLMGVGITTAAPAFAGSGGCCGCTGGSHAGGAEIRS